MWLVCSLFWALRLVLLCAPGYVHPDEYFQSVEPFALPNTTQLTWEWQPQHAVRSVVAPYVVFAVPHTLLGAHVWWSCRMVVFFFSFVLDACVWRLSDGNSRALLAFASSWPALTLAARSFSNSLEAAAFCGFLLLLLPTRALSSLRVAGAAAVMAVASFCRFTFPAFALVPLLGRLRQFSARLLLLFVTAGVVVAALHVWIDSSFYGRWTLTPLNALLYNSQTENVAQHGLHPRITHALVNLPMLLGPVALFGLRFRLVWVVPLVFLSLVPHQEPRFLLPLVAPCFAVSEPPKSKLAFAAHMFYHGAVTFFFGFVHQAGVVPALRYLTEAHSPVAFWRTYPPPTAFLKPSNNSALTVFDMRGLPWSQVRHVLQTGGTLVAPFESLPEHMGAVLLQCWTPHLSTEHFPSSISGARLCAWKVHEQKQ